MSATTKIEWCDSTVNPVMGCEGCELWNGHVQTCYAGILHRRFGGSTTGYAPSFEEVTKFPGRMAEAARWRDLAMEERPHKPWLNNQPRFIFISDMGDSLSSIIDFPYLREEVVNQVQSESGRSHIWLWLTKRPQRMADFFAYLREQGVDWPENLWPGTSLTTETSLSRLAPLRCVGHEGLHRFLSVESAFILWKEPPTGGYGGYGYGYGYYGGLRWALVRLSNLSDGDQWGTVE